MGNGANMTIPTKSAVVVVGACCEHQDTALCRAGDLLCFRPLDRNLSANSSAATSSIKTHLQLISFAERTISLSNGLNLTSKCREIVVNTRATVLQSSTALSAMLRAADTKVRRADTSDDASGRIVKCPRASDAGIFRMPDSTPSPETKTDLLNAVAITHAGRNMESLLIPGRGVSVQIGASPVADGPVSCAQVRILALLNTAVWCEISYQTPNGEWRKQRLGGPQIIVVAALVSHTLKWWGNAKVVILLLEPRFVHETANAKIQGVTTGDVTELGQRDALIVQLTDAFHSLCFRERRPPSLYVESIGTVMATHVLQLFFGGESPVDRRGGLPTEALQRVVRYVDDHFCEGFDPAAIARVSGYSRNHFQRLFRMSLNQTPRDYVRGVQVQHAILLLQTTALKGLDVALACGFCDETQMARWFWKLRQCLPGQVREIARW